MIILVLASIWSWAIIINKWLVLGTLRAAPTNSRRRSGPGFRSTNSISNSPRRPIIRWRRCSIRRLREWRRAFEGGPPREALLPGIKDRIDKAMSVTIHRETDGIERQLGFLATVGATAPFVGLFGTVWGIMNSFSAIAARHDTTLAVVAPGIAEALFATAMGLLAAIPAVIFYNKFVNDIGRYTTGSKASPTNSPRSCRASSTKRRSDGRRIQAVSNAGAARAHRVRCRRSTSRPSST
jgi:biopolymer transport protein TolQ